MCSSDLNRLPELGIKTFSGQLEDWTEFWEWFLHNIDHRTEYEPHEKLRHLKPYLRGEAVIRIAETDANYPIAKTKLESKYGQKDRLIDHINNKLLSLKTVTKPNELKSLVLEFEKYCQMLEAMGENVNDNRQIEHGLMIKLPKRALAKILETKKSSASWSTQNFRDELSKLVEIEEIVEENYSHSHAQKQDEKPSFRKKFGKTGHSFAAIDSTDKKNKNCAFCNKPHNTYYCDTYISPIDRFNKTKELELCTNCLSKGHFNKDCIQYKMQPLCKKAL